MLVEDPDAPGGTFVHWVAWGIDPSRGGLAEGETPPWLRRRHGSAGEPTAGRFRRRDRAHRYVFIVFAVSVVLDLRLGTSANDLRQTATNRVIAQGQPDGPVFPCANDLQLPTSRGARAARSVDVLPDDPDQCRQALEERGPFAVGHRGDPALVLLVEGGCHPYVDGAALVGETEPVLPMVVRIPLAHQESFAFHLRGQPADAALLQPQRSARSRWDSGVAVSSSCSANACDSETGCPATVWSGCSRPAARTTSINNSWRRAASAESTSMRSQQHHPIRKNSCALQLSRRTVENSCSTQLKGG